MCQLIRVLYLRHFFYLLNVNIFDYFSLVYFDRDGDNAYFVAKRNDDEIFRIYVSDIQRKAIREGKAEGNLKKIYESSTNISVIERCEEIKRAFATDKEIPYDICELEQFIEYLKYNHNNSYYVNLTTFIRLLSPFLSFEFAISLEYLAYYIEPLSAMVASSLRVAKHTVSIIGWYLTLDFFKNRFMPSPDILAKTRSPLKDSTADIDAYKEKAENLLEMVRVYTALVSIYRELLYDAIRSVRPIVNDKDNPRKEEQLSRLIEIVKNFNAEAREMIAIGSDPGCITALYSAYLSEIRKVGNEANNLLYGTDCDEKQAINDESIPEKGTPFVLVTLGIRIR